MFLGEKSQKEKVQIRTQNEEIVETDMDIWYYTYKEVIRVKKEQCNVSSRKNNLSFAFKGPSYARNIVFFINFLAYFWKYLKN